MRSEPNKFTWTEYPLIDAVDGGRYRRLSDEEVAAELAEGTSPEVLGEYYKAREERINLARRDPFQGEIPLPHWERLEEAVRQYSVVWVPGGNNPGKSWWAGSLVMRFLTRRFTWEGQSTGKLKVLMVSQDELASKMFQQPAVYAHFPLSWRVINDSTGKKPPRFIKCVNYSDKNGFTEESFVLPDKRLRGQCWFKTVAQYTREPQSFEGPAYDLVVIDEGCPVPLFRTLLARAAKLSGKIVYLLTCIHGYDQTLGQALEGAKLVETRPMQWQWE